MNITETLNPAQKELPLGLGLRCILFHLIQPAPRDRLGWGVRDREVKGAGGVDLSFKREFITFLYFLSLETNHKVSHCEADHVFSIKIMLQLEVTF